MHNWKLISTKVVFDGYRKVERHRYLMPDNEEREFDIVDTGQSVCALVITKDNQVVLAKEFRPGPGKVLLELPGGGINDGEDAETAIKREVAEETGYSGDIQPVGRAYKDAYSTHTVSGFLITNAEITTVPENNPAEPISVELLSIEEFKEHLLGGDLTDITTAHQALARLESKN